MNINTYTHTNVLIFFLKREERREGVREGHIEKIDKLKTNKNVYL